MNLIIHQIVSNIGKILTKKTSRQNNEDKLSSHIQRILNFTIGNFCYGPLKTKLVDSEKIMICSNWKQGKREPFKGKESRVDSYPFAATCSPFVGLILGLFLGSSNYEPIWGRSITKALKENKFLKKNSSFLFKSRKASFDNLPKLNTPLTVALYRSHVVLIINADLVNIYDPRTKEKCTGLWVLGADGSLKSQKKDNKIIKMFYSTKDLTFEPAEERGQRQRNYSDKYKLINLVALKSPKTKNIPDKLPIEICEQSLKILKEKGHAE